MNGLPDCSRLGSNKERAMRRAPSLAVRSPVRSLTLPALRSLTLPALLGALLACTGMARGQPPGGNNLPNPRLLTLTPCGAKAGTTVEVAFTGIDLEEPQTLLFSHPGIK